jgi:hypothetical protein
VEATPGVADTLAMHRLLASAALAVTVACGGSSAKPAAAPEPAPVAVAAAPTPATPAFTCAQTVAKMMGMQGDDLFGAMAADKRPTWIARFTALLTTSCEEDRWPPEVLSCSAAAKDKHEMDVCGEKVSADAQAKMMKRVEPFMQELMADMGAAAAPTAPTTTIAVAPTGVAACDRYLATMQRYIACEQVPQQARDASAAAMQTLQASFASLSDKATTDEARRAAADACQQSTDALLQAAQAIGCTLSPAATDGVEPAKPAKQPAKKAKKAKKATTAKPAAP